MDFAKFPKVELHLHLDCSLSYKVVSKIDPTITKEIFLNDYVAPEKCVNLADFLTRAPKGFALMQTKEELTLVVDDLFDQLLADHVIYAEIRFAPLQHLSKGLSAIEVVEATEAATAAAIKRTGIEARLILCTLRHYTAEQSMETVKLVVAFKDSTVAGFDIAADEAGFPIDNHIDAFKYARSKNIHCTAHAGEAKGPESVWETLEFFGPTRIGHGVRSYEDQKLVNHLIKEKIHLEVCPACNVQINLFNTYQDHPIDQLYKAGVSLSVSNDARTIVNIDLNREYKRLATEFGWTKNDFYHCNAEAINASFISTALKADLLDRLNKGYAD